MNDLNGLSVEIALWADDRGLGNAEPSKQMLKLIEEVGELASGIAKNDRDLIIDSIGDVFVVLKILSLQLDLNLTDCVAVSYAEIADRKGKIIDGVFVKESDIKTSNENDEKTEVNTCITTREKI